MAKYEHNSEKFGYIDLDGLAGVQDALAKLGYNPGKVDGKDGPNTQQALRAFQAHLTIKIDGIVGPQTRQGLTDELAAKAKDSASS
jgi:zinc D-Ala-D-Ala carboxypeptidase